MQSTLCSRSMAVIVAGLGLMLAGCNSAQTGKGPEASGSAAASGANGVDLSQTVGDSGLVVREYMTHLVNSNAEDLWKWQATVTDANGEHSTVPTNDDEWEQAESAALTLRELTKPLATIGRGNPTWDARYGALKSAIDDAAKHAEDKDEAAFFADGLKLDNACVACHHAFAPQLEIPPRIGPQEAKSDIAK